MAIDEKADSAIYAIKAKIKFTDQTSIIDNDILLSASTESTIEMRDITINGLHASGPIVQTVSADLLLEDVTISGITYDHTVNTFSKISILNDSKFTARRSILQTIAGPLLEVRGRSVVDFDDNMKVLDILNDSTMTPLIQIATSTAHFTDTTFTTLKQSNHNLLIDMV